MSQNNPQHEQQIDKLTNQVAQLTQTVTEYAAVTKRHMDQQDQINKQLFGLTNGQDQRLRELEQWRAVKDATIPRRLIDGDRVDADIRALQGQIEAIKRWLAKWAGAAIAAMALANLLLPRLVDGVVTLFKGAP